MEVKNKRMRLDPEVEKTKEINFQLHQAYDSPNSTKQIVCNYCGNDKFYVGKGNYYTVVKCLKCNQEECVHDG